MAGSRSESRSGWGPYSASYCSLVRRYSVRMFSAANASFGVITPETPCGDTHTTVSAIFCASSSSCRLTMTATCFSCASWRRMVSSSILPLMSKNDVGSSSMIISGCWQTARASRTRWRWPSLILVKSRSASSSACTRCRASRTCILSCSDRMPSRPV